jgi:putative thioredoxin
LARVLGTGGDTESALELLERVTGTPALETEAGHLAAELRTREGSDDEAALRARLANDPDDLEARLALGRALAAARRFEEALTELLEVVVQDRSFADEGARKTMIDVFELLGSEDPLTERFRGELARALFR